MNCRHFLQKHCQSCDLLSQDYTSSLVSKEQRLSQLFPSDQSKIKQTVICEMGTNGSRNKAKLAVKLVQHHIEFGFYDHTGKFKQLEDCPLHAPAINAVLIDLRKKLSAYRIDPYDLATRSGELKYILITYSDSTNELLLRFVLRSKKSLNQFRLITNDLMANNAHLKVVTANIQPIHQAILEGDEEIVLTDVDCIAHQFDEYVLYQGPRSFFQTNSEMALCLYRQFQSELSLLAAKSMLDLYCGVGAFAFFAEKYCENVTGVEISQAAIHYAVKAREMNRSRIDFQSMDVEKFLVNQLDTSYDVIVVNPPRRGLNQTIISHLIRLFPEYLFYSSCNVETLQRDVLHLSEYYQVKSLQIFDMFPFTSHFETLAVLQKRI